jgi:tripartite-type tricarboxylate transporter receptor subunit TctC
VPLAAGSNLDTIEKVTGADGSFGTGRAAHARPDGYTVDLGYQGSNVLNDAFYSLSYDILNDFAPISPVATTSDQSVAAR